MTLEFYRIKLAEHDWFYEFSDDHSVWQSGVAAEARLANAAREGGIEFKRAFNVEYAKHFHQPPSFSPPYKFPFKDAIP